MSYNLFLDDEREPGQVNRIDLPNGPWIIVRSYDAFISMIEMKGLPEFITFDHDLADQHYGHGLNEDEIPYDSYTEKTGYDCAKWLVEYCMDNKLKFPGFDVHSMNPVGSLNIISYIESAKRFGAV